MASKATVRRFPSRPASTAPQYGNVAQDVEKLIEMEGNPVKEAVKGGKRVGPPQRFGPNKTGRVNPFAGRFPTVDPVPSPYDVPRGPNPFSGKFPTTGSPYDVPTGPNPFEGRIPDVTQKVGKLAGLRKILGLLGRATGPALTGLGAYSLANEYLGGDAAQYLAGPVGIAKNAYDKIGGNPDNMPELPPDLMAMLGPSVENWSNPDYLNGQIPDMSRVSQTGRSGMGRKRSGSGMKMGPDYMFPDPTEAAIAEGIPDMSNFLPNSGGDAILEDPLQGRGLMMNKGITPGLPSSTGLDPMSTKKKQNPLLTAIKWMGRQF